VNRKLRVLLVQLPVPNNPATNVPLAAGYLKAYAEAQGLLDRVRVDILPRALADHAGDAMLVDAIVADQPDVLGISLYTWNSERSLGIATRVKARLPGIFVVVGGPEVQRDNDWVLCHPAVDVAVIGEGEQTFYDLLLQIVDCRLQIDSANLQSAIYNLQSIAGLAFRDAQGDLVFTPDRVALSNLAPIPSPYLLGYLEPSPIMMIEISRWCPYACGFCLYGRNMGPKLGNRYFPLERILAELQWGKAHGATQIHFVEANLNLVPVFWPLMRALEDLNADGALALYAELRGEHLTDEVVGALARAGLKVAEVGLQTANPVALRVAHRRTDLQKWAAGTRRLARQGVEVYLDVILGLPADDAAGLAATLEFIQRENLGPYDVFTLQVLPGTATRSQAGEYRLVYQDRPPYYIFGTDRLSYAELRRLRRELKLGAAIDPGEVEGCPPPRLEALQIVDCRLQIDEPHLQSTIYNLQLIDRVCFVDADAVVWAEAEDCVNRLASHVDVVARWEDAAELASWLAKAIAANPATLFDCYLLGEAPSVPEDLRAWRDALPYMPGYLDRVAVYRREAPEPAHDRVSPRCFVVLPWASQAEPADYCGAAEIIWMYDLAAGDAPPLGAWAAAGGAGVWVRGRPEAEVARWGEECDVRLWSEAAE
jgi:radical SAM superfamily enzyme YgiQ (UPF0313 family)